ncbi:U-scoloptoxin(01)-Er1a-like [Centruroides vittatus]|uniref:U-scoloptoxin(01)-Er1a-like n=1 Tax=Centruroides vittatus TaxID=120091 RepID=UPI00350EF439
MVKYFVIAMIIIVAVALPRVKRRAYDLPDGAELIVESIKTTFSCEGLGRGYYADVDNECKIFHICNPITHADGTQESEQYSFFCGNLTIFNQLSLTCNYPEDSIPCEKAKDFYYVNDNIGYEEIPFLTEEDVEKAQQVINENRIQR